MDNVYKIIIALIIVFIVFIIYKNEWFDTTPQGAQFFNEPIYTSGADLRFFGTTFTGTDQGRANNVPIPGYDYS